MKNYIPKLISNCILVLIAGCKNSSDGYNTIEELYKKTLVTIKSKDKAKIANFVTEMLPDKNSAEYMKNNNCVYRGFPK